MRMARLRDSAAPPVGAHPQRARLTLPSCLRLADSPPHGLGVFAAAPLQRGVRMGPYEGRPVREDTGAGGGYSWRVRDGRLVDASVEAYSNWMRFVNGAPHAARRNLAGFQHHGALYFRTVTPVAVGEELLIYYGDDYGCNAEGYYNYIPPKEEELKPGLAATGDSGDPGNDYARNVSVEGSCHNGVPEEDTESKFIGIVYKEEPEPEIGGGDEDAVDINGYCDYGLPKEEPEQKFEATDVDGDCGDADMRDLAADGYSDLPKQEPELVICDDYCDYGSLKKEPKPELGGGSADADDEYACNIDIDGYCDQPKDEPEFVAVGDDAVAEGDRDVSYDCSHCGISLCTREFKVKHELRCKIQVQQRKLESQIMTLYRCDYCKCPLLNKEYKEQHQKWCRKKPVSERRDSNGIYLECHKCKFVTKRKGILERHLLNHNKNNAEWLICTQCSYKTVHKYDMSRHMKIHGNSFSCCCPICGKSFRVKPRLDDHLLRQHSDKWDEVSKLITSKIHTCNICNQYRTIAKTSLNAHVALIHHKGDGCEKYECPCCSYSTFHKQNLKRHSKIHLEQRDYRCTGCIKQFSQKRGLDLHIFRNHADNVDLMKTITSKINCRESSTTDAHSIEVDDDRPPEAELAATDGGDEGGTKDVNDYYDSDMHEEEPESKSVDIFDHPVKEDPE